MGIHDGHRARKKDQFLRMGLDSFADHEALELLLFYAIPRRDTNPIAHALLNKFGSLSGVLNADVEELQQVEGVGESAALLLTLLPELTHRAMRAPAEEKILNSVDSCGKFFLKRFAHERREVLCQVCLDAKYKLITCKKLSEGDADSAAFSVRQVVENALLANAAIVVLGHNHTSGVALPSESDQIVTRRVNMALKTMDIKLMDHIIVSDGDFVSMAQSNML